ncbi:hypothetical protein EJ08DRAFT_693655 [Tothia fuscella]|uniref:Uncharacterized protein n=1 Tax=Tothia fuscella TaxID=1048955 RepID=A0A9P4NZJ5_9PEZI|nr:hypothetical protein EJ08DRAFT_693655 [Tothia fuscella]
MARPNNQKRKYEGKKSNASRKYEENVSKARRELKDLLDEQSNLSSITQPLNPRKRQKLPGKAVSKKRKGDVPKTVVGEGVDLPATIAAPKVLETHDHTSTRPTLEFAHDFLITKKYGPRSMVRKRIIRNQAIARRLTEAFKAKHEEVLQERNSQLHETLSSLTLQKKKSAVPCFQLSSDFAFPRFLEFPREIRDTIYEFVAEEQPFLFPQEFLHPLHVDRRFHSLHALLSIRNHQVLNEAAPVLLDKCAIYLEDFRDMEWLFNWARITEPTITLPAAWPFADDHIAPGPSFTDEELKARWSEEVIDYVRVSGLGELARLKHLCEVQILNTRWWLKKTRDIMDDYMWRQFELLATELQAILNDTVDAHDNAKQIPLVHTSVFVNRVGAVAESQSGSREEEHRVMSSHHSFEEHDIQDKGIKGKKWVNLNELSRDLLACEYPPEAA